MIKKNLKDLVDKPYGDIHLYEIAGIHIHTSLGLIKEMYIDPLHLGLEPQTGWLIFKDYHAIGNTPIFDITVSAANEHGQMAQMKLFNVKTIDKDNAGSKLKFEFTSINLWEMIHDRNDKNKQL